MVGKKLGILFLAAVILAFLTGYFSQSLLPALQLGDTGDSFDLITKQIKDRYYYEIDSNEIDQAYIEALQSVVSTYSRIHKDPYTRLVETPTSSTYYSDEAFVGIGITFVFSGNIINIEDVDTQSDLFNRVIPGDQIIGVVEGTAEILFENLSSQEEVLNRLTGSLGSTKTLIVKTRDLEVNLIEITYKELLFPSVSTLELPDPSLAYIKISQFNGALNDVSPGTSTLFNQALQTIELEKLNLNSEQKTLIIDVRDNPGGALTALHNSGDIETPQGVLQLLLRRNIGKPLFSMIPRNESQALHFYGTRSNAKPYNIAVLVNENSASAAEVLAAALWDSGGYQLYGTQTYGKNVYQNSIRLFEFKQIEYTLTYTEGKWFYDVEKDVVSHPLVVNNITQQGIKTIEIPIYMGEIMQDQVNNYLTTYQKFLNFYFDFDEMNSLRTDGYFDQATKDAIEAYQLENGLAVTGTLNHITAMMIYRDYKEAINNYQNDHQLMELILELSNTL